MTQQSSPIEGKKPRRELVVLADSDAIAHAACGLVRESAEAAVAARGRFRLVLAGGSTPKALYRLLAQSPGLPWDSTDIFFGDERTVPPDHSDSNARMANEALLAQPFIPSANVHRLRGELPPADAARAYEQELRTLFPASEFPVFDLVLLGLGPDGHTASLFPHTAALAERAWVVPNWVEKFDTFRLTMTYPVFNAARSVLFLIAGADKASALHQLLEEEGPVEDIPSRGIRPTSGVCSLLVDRAAAAQLSRESLSD